MKAAALWFNSFKLSPFLEPEPGEHWSCAKEILFWESFVVSRRVDWSLQRKDTQCNVECSTISWIGWVSHSWNEKKHTGGTHWREAHWNTLLERSSAEEILFWESFVVSRLSCVDWSLRRKDTQCRTQNYFMNRMGGSHTLEHRRKWKENKIILDGNWCCRPVQTLIVAKTNQKWGLDQCNVW